MRREQQIIKLLLQLYFQVTGWKDHALLGFVAVLETVLPYVVAVLVQSFWGNDSQYTLTLIVGVGMLQLVTGTFGIHPMYVSLGQISRKAEIAFNDKLLDAISSTSTERMDIHKHNINKDAVRAVNNTVRDIIFRIPRWMQQICSMLFVLLPVCAQFPVIIPIIAMMSAVFYEFVLRKRMHALTQLHVDKAKNLKGTEDRFHGLFSHCYAWKINGLVLNTKECLSQLHATIHASEEVLTEHLEYTFYIFGVFLTVVQVTIMSIVVVSDPGNGFMLMLIWQMTQAFTRLGNFTLITVRDLHTRWLPSLEPIMAFLDDLDDPADQHCVDIGGDEQVVLRGINTTRGDFTLSGDDIVLKPHGTYLLKGHNGHGKSTFIDLILGAIGDNLTVNIQGKTHRGLISSSNRLAVLQGEKMVQLGISIRDNFKFFCTSVNDSDVQFWIDTVGLGALSLTEPLQGLSGGQCQRLTIALILCKATIEGTPLVILDEANSEVGETEYPFCDIIQNARHKYRGIIIATVHSNSVSKQIRTLSHYEGDIVLDHGQITTTSAVVDAQHDRAVLESRSFTMT